MKVVRSTAYHSTVGDLTISYNVKPFEDTGLITIRDSSGGVLFLYKSALLALIEELKVYAAILP
jgi:hypothetical protein